MTSLAGLANPGLLLIVGAALVPFMAGRLRKIYLVALPLAGIALLIALPDGTVTGPALFDFVLAPLRIDRLSFLFALIFLIAATLGMLYAVNVKDTVQQVASLVYAGAAIGATLAGDLLSFLVYWEITAYSSVFLILASHTERAYRAAMRYLVVQIGSGVLLLLGIAVHYNATGSIAFDHLGLATPGGVLILLAFGVKCAFPLLHNWLQDAYPEATATGTVILSAFTTKLAVYALARGYAGTEILIYIGAAMTVFPIFFAVLENDLRRVLAYSLNNQLGFMVVGVGVGTELALNGTAAHAFCHILYKALLFMSMGAVLHRVGTVKASELGGLYKSMPVTTGCCIVGSLSISGFPLFSGFISKSMILTAAAGQGYWGVWLVLLFASAGVMDHSGIKVPFFSFFAHDRGLRCAEAPRNMRWAMLLTAAACVFLGVVPGALYALLPFPVDYAPYTTAHVITQTQLLLFAALGFVFLMKTGLYPPEIRGLNIDSDWWYRRGVPALLRCTARGLRPLRDGLRAGMTRSGQFAAGNAATWFGPGGLLGGGWPTGGIIYVTVAVLGFVLLAILATGIGR